MTLLALRENLKSIQFGASGYCPACHGWEVHKGFGCYRGVHMANCWLKELINE